ncbi:hypothetical protein [Oceanobacillus salinisoli]|uniref:hypothetical protein n=1 Tax=Oceanobacillus salinisoli TaxID=2678611 RepID=UPI0012E2C172|nr:hypothetical protein [Oceanobacillus salinisoli]
MKGQEETQLDQSLKSLNENISWDNEKQQHSRRLFLSKLEQVRSSKRKSWIRRSAVPIVASILFLGTTTTLFVSEHSVQQQNNSLVQNENMSGNNTDQVSSIGMDEEVESNIEEINEAGFDLRLPQYSPTSNTEIKNLIQRSAGKTTNVTANYYDGEGKQIFTFLQEDISEINENNNNNGINHMKENADYKTEINGNEAFYNENDNSGLKTLNIITNGYGFTLSTYHLSEEQLIKIGESIDF